MLDAIVLDLDNSTAVHATVNADVDVLGLVALDLGVDADVDLDLFDASNVKA